jgi:hypothetical protein
VSDDPIREARELIERSRRELLDHLRALLAKGSAQAQHIDNSLLTLTAGALLLSITFVGTLSASKQCLNLLFVAWAAFILSMICVIVGMMRPQLQSHQDAVNTANNLERFSQMSFVDAAQQRPTFPVGTQKTIASLNVIALVGFIIGVGFLCSFVGINLSQHKPPVSKAAAPSNQSLEPTADPQENSPTTSPTSIPQASRSPVTGGSAPSR